MNTLSRMLRPHFNRHVAVIVFLFGLAAYRTMYTLAVYDVSTRFIASSGTGFPSWRGVVGTLFPWPYTRIEPLGAYFIGLSSTDQFIYLYLISSGALAVICISLWILGFFALNLYVFMWANESLYQRLTAEAPENSP